MVTKSWFILPPSQAWFYKKYNSDFSLPPDYKDDCSAMTKDAIEMIYPRNFTKVFVPVEIDGEKGKVVFEAAHQNPKARIFWYLDQFYIGETRNHHQLGIFPDAGSHLLSLVDDSGRTLSVPFEAINDRNFKN
jgi:penicillin-binding protein 1C